MKFSKDKKPTEPGWCWCAVQGKPERPFPVEVWESHLSSGVLLCGSSGKRLNSWDVLWGDRIETPAVDKD